MSGNKLGHHPTDWYIKQGKDQGKIEEVKNGSKHLKLYAVEDQSEFTCQRAKDLSPGLEHALVRWLRGIGVILTLALLFGSLLLSVYYFL